MLAKPLRRWARQERRVRIYVKAQELADKNVGHITKVNIFSDIGYRSWRLGELGSGGWSYGLRPRRLAVLGCTARVAKQPQFLPHAGGVRIEQVMNESVKQPCKPMRSLLLVV